MDGGVELVPLFKKELELCKVRTGETVGIYMEGGRLRTYAQAFAIAAGDLGAEVFVVDLPLTGGRGSDEAGVPVGGAGLSRHPEVVDAFKRADMLIDLCLLLWTPEKHQIQGAGTRILSCIEPVDVLQRLFPTDDQRRRSEESEAMLRAASELRVTSDAGTDLTYELGQYRAFCQYGYTDEPGRWDHFASTHAVHAANDGGVNGTLVLQPGDALTAFGRYIEEPVRMKIEDGYIRSIEGGFDAWLIESYIARFDDEQASAVSHIGWGNNENARWDAHAIGSGGIGMDARAWIGNVMFSIGPNIEFGGTNGTACHIDIPMRGCSLELDGEAVVDRGRIVKQSLLPSTSAAVA
ncbi:MAG: 2,5-dihydroxypyridine 5,6-dioxygenase [Solirubrobacteraceae bacterium]|jgi:2,5-dihydroxypyridine 5,6-dioxygenase|nr:2,5-dihydroxypyridine 5,6-dioxygenase [Solirubrobacteraceae bacterium]